MKRFVFPREVLLVEVERRCAEAACGARARVGLTKPEARAYSGFECEACGVWNEDALAERDIPEWWEELKVASLEGLRPPRAGEEGVREDEEGPVARLSDAWRAGGSAPRSRRSGGGEEKSADGEDSF